MARECKTLEEAIAVDGVIHIESGAKIIAYTAKDVLPMHCKVAQGAPGQAVKEVTLEDLDARLRKLEK